LELRKLGTRPDLQILQRTDVYKYNFVEARKIERRFIRKFFREGYDLVNVMYAPKKYLKLRAKMPANKPSVAQ
jgi:predicted ATPase